MTSLLKKLSLRNSNRSTEKYFGDSNSSSGVSDKANGSSRWFKKNQSTLENEQAGNRLCRSQSYESEEWHSGRSSGYTEGFREGIRRASEGGANSIRRLSGTYVRRCSFCKDEQMMEHTDFCPQCVTSRGSSEGMCLHTRRASLRRCSECNLSFQDLDNGQERILI